MAVIIRDIDLPKSCNECFAFDKDCEYCQLYSCSIPAICDIYDPSKRQEWCELEEEQMAVIIKDVEMPKSCDCCFAYDASYDCCKLYSNGIPKHYNLLLLSERPDWCELEEVKE